MNLTDAFVNREQNLEPFYLSKKRVNTEALLASELVFSPSFSPVDHLKALSIFMKARRFNIQAQLRRIR